MSHASSIAYVPRRTFLAWASGCALVLAALVPSAVGPTVAARAVAPTTPFLSELHYDNAGADAGEFVEVHLPAGTGSAGMSVVLYNGATGTAYHTDPLPAISAAADAPAAVVVSYPVNGMQNGHRTPWPLSPRTGRPSSSSPMKES